MRVDVVHESERVLAVLIVVLDRALDLDVFARRFERDRLGMQGTPVADDPLHEFGQAALIVEGLFLRAPLALVLENDRERLVQEGELAQAVGDGGVVEARVREDLGVGLEPDRRTRAFRLANDLELLLRVPALERHVMPFPVAVHPHLEFLGQGVHHRDADAVQTARHLVAALVELAAGVEDREGDFYAGLLLGLVEIDGNAAPVVHDCDRVVRVNRDGDVRAVTRERLVHGVVHHLIDEMVQTAGGHRPDVHRRTAAHRLQPLQDLDRIGLVVAVAFACAFFRLGRHQNPNVKGASVLS